MPRKYKRVNKRFKKKQAKKAVSRKAVTKIARKVAKKVARAIQHEDDIKGKYVEVTDCTIAAAPSGAFNTSWLTSNEWTYNKADVHDQALCVGDPRQLNTIAATLFGTKTPGNDWSNQTGEIVGNIKFRVTKAQAKFCFYWNSVFPGELEIFEIVPKKNYGTGTHVSGGASLYTAYQHGLGNIEYTGSGAYTAATLKRFGSELSDQSFSQEYFKVKKTMHKLVPGGCIEYMLSEKPGMFDQQKYNIGAVADPNFNTFTKGRGKYLEYRFRALPTMAAAGSTNGGRVTFPYAGVLAGGLAVVMERTHKIVIPEAFINLAKSAIRLAAPTDPVIVAGQGARLVTINTMAPQGSLVTSQIDLMNPIGAAASQ